MMAMDTNSKVLRKWNLIAREVSNCNSPAEYVKIR